MPLICKKNLQENAATSPTISTDRAFCDGIQLNYCYDFVHAEGSFSTPKRDTK